MIFLNSAERCNITSSLISSKLLRGLLISKSILMKEKWSLLILNLENMLSYSGKILRSKGLMRAITWSSPRRRWKGSLKKVLSWTLSIKDLYYVLKSKAFWTNIEQYLMELDFELFMLRYDIFSIWSHFFFVFC